MDKNVEYPASIYQLCQVCPHASAIQLATISQMAWENRTAPAPVNRKARHLRCAWLEDTALLFP